MPVRRLIDTASVTLPEASDLRRRSPRPRDMRPPDYVEKFDDTTIAYDVFTYGNMVSLVGPPLLSLGPALAVADWTIGGERVTPLLRDLDRVQESWFTRQSAAGESLQIDLDTLSLSASIQPDEAELFRDRRVLFTKSKNNELEWIHDWAQFYNRVHGVDALLLYDNGSDKYSADDLLSSLDVDGIDVAVVVKWPFKFGPQGGNWDGTRSYPWDSDFCEYGVLTHARRRFLGQASAIVHQDIDELVVTDDGASLFDHLARSESGLITYRGKWIESVTSATNTPPRFYDFVHLDARRNDATTKWAAVPKAISSARQWKTHYVAGVPATMADQVAHRHFMGITTGWKWNRSDRVVFDPARHRRDTHLASAFTAAFGPDAFPRPAVESLVASPKEALDRLSPLIDSKRRFREGFIKEWLWEGRVLVLEFKSRTGVQFAFELRSTEAGLSLQLTGRDDNSWYAIRRACGGYGKRRAGTPRHLQLTWWRRSTDLNVIAGDIIAYVQRAASDLAGSRVYVPDRSIASYWWNLKPNFGDLLGPWIIELITGRPVHNTIEEPNAGQALMTVGSILTETLRPGLSVWGSGLIAPLDAKWKARLATRKPSSIHAVRGKLTRDELVTKLGWDVPEVYGDPALLLPHFVQFGQRPSNRPPVGFIPHYAHKRLFANSPESGGGVHQIEVQCSAESVVEELAQSSSVVSTSLHGLIIAQAYGIPWVWLRVSDSALFGDTFKFEDFFSVLDREAVQMVTVTKEEASTLDLAELAGRAALPDSRFDAGALLDAFPVERSAVSTRAELIFPATALASVELEARE